MPSGSQMSWTMISSTIPDSCLSNSYGICSSFSHLFPFFLCIVSHDDIQMEYLCQASPVASAPIDPPHLPWSIDAYDPNGFARKHMVGRNTNVMGYPFPEGTRAVSFLILFALSFPLSLNHLF